MFYKSIVFVIDSFKFIIQFGYLILLLLYFKLELLFIRFKLRNRRSAVSQFDFLLGKLLLKQSVLLRCLSDPLLKDRCGTMLSNGLFNELDRVQRHSVSGLDNVCDNLAAADD